MDAQAITKIYQFIKTINDFKLVDRLTIVKQNGRRESDAEHCWHVAVSVMLLAPLYDKPIDQNRAMKMALIHDLVEIYAGDVYAFASDEDRAKKQEREIEAAGKLFSQLPTAIKTEFQDLWDEYEKRESEESKFVSAIDKLMPMIQYRIAKGDALPNTSIQNEARKQEQEQKLRATSPIFGFLFDKISEEKI